MIHHSDIRNAQYAMIVVSNIELVRTCKVPNDLYHYLCNCFQKKTYCQYLHNFVHSFVINTMCSTHFLMSKYNSIEYVPKCKFKVKNLFRQNKMTFKTYNSRTIFIFRISNILLLISYGIWITQTVFQLGYSL